MVSSCYVDLPCSASVSGLNGFNVLLSGSQTPHPVGPPSGQLPSLSIPCMVLPSPTLGTFPVLYSPTMPRPVSSAPGAIPNVGPVNFGLPGLGSTAHLLIGPANMVNPKSSTLSSADPQLQCPGSLNLSPVISRSHNTIQPESPMYGGHPVSVVKLQQVSPKVSPGRSSLCDGVCLPLISFESHDCRTEALGQGLPSFHCTPRVICLFYKAWRY